MKDGKKIPPEKWDTSIEPGCRIRIRLHPQKRFGINEFGSDAEQTSETDEDDVDSTDDGESVDERDFKYRVEYFVKPARKHEFPSYLFSTTHDDPVVIEMTKRKAKPKGRCVLEEIKTVHFRYGKLAQHKQSLREHGPKLGDGDSVYKNLRIGSDALLNVLRSVVKCSSSAPSGADDDVFSFGLFKYPFEDLVHHRKELSDYKMENSGPRVNHTPEYNARCDRHIDLLIQYLENEPSLRLKSIESKWTKKVPTTTFADLWLLMKPGTDVYVREYEQLNAYVIDQLAGGIDHSSQSNWSSKARSYTIRVWCLEFNGLTIGRVGRILQVPIFDGEREIMSLPLFPTFFQDKLDGGTRRKQLIDRGKKYFQYSKGPSFLEHTGSGLTTGSKKVSSCSNITS